MRRLAILLALLVALVSCGGESTDPSPTPSAMTVSLSGSPSAKIWQGQCAACHGAAGEGNRALGAPALTQLVATALLYPHPSAPPHISNNASSPTSMATHTMLPASPGLVPSLSSTPAVCAMEIATASSHFAALRQRCHGALLAWTFDRCDGGGDVSINQPAAVSGAVWLPTWPLCGGRRVHDH